MKRSLLAAAAVVLLADAFALIHAARNRSGLPLAEVTLSDRELSFEPHVDDSGVRLELRWHGFERLRPASRGNRQELESIGMTTQQLARLGFDVSLAPDAVDAERFYRQQAARSAFAAFEYAGPIGQARLLAIENDPALSTAVARPNLEADGRRERGDSRLFAIDVDASAAALRARYSGRKDVFVLPAVIGLNCDKPFVDPAEHKSRLARVVCYIREVPADIHVPRPFSDAFRRYQGLKKPEDRPGELYRVRLRFGQLGEPWVTGVEFPFESNPR